MSLRLQPIRVATGSPDAVGQLAFSGDFLVAVLVHLSDEHEDMSGMWFLEAGFGPVDTATPPTFTDLDAAQSWIKGRLAQAA
jgi:hypothetical protein